jgi:hypothetical protein
MARTSELVLAEETTALQVFSKEGGLDPIIQEAKDFVADFEHDLSTGAGRKRTASLAAKVAKLKVRLDDMGKEVIADAKAKVKLVDGSRKGMRDELDELKVLARKPLTDWEEEEERIREETRLKLEAKRLAEQVESDHEMALLMNENIDRHAADKAAEVERQRQAEADRAAQEQAEREARLQQEAADNARAEAERKAQAERDQIDQDRRDALRREQEAKDKAAQAERDRIAAEERAKQQEQERIRSEAQAKENARVLAEQTEINRKKAEERAVQQEKKRHEYEAQALEASRLQREADKAHVSDVRRKAKECLMAYGMSEDMAKSIVIAIHKGGIANVTIKY